MIRALRFTPSRRLSGRRRNLDVGPARIGTDLVGFAVCLFGRGVLVTWA